ncbi:MAG: adenylate kinase family protein [Candidatus Hodarchaeales archaeon]|jgi:adenylate kinase
MAFRKNNSALRIYITGTPGTGKSSVAKLLSAKLSLEFLEINDLVVQEGYNLGYDIDRDTTIADDELLNEFLNQKLTTTDRVCIAGGIVLSNTLFNYIIILHSSVSTLRTRLEEREYSKTKVESNIEAEIMNIIYYETLEHFPPEKILEVINDNKSIEKTCSEIISVIG